MIDQKINKTLMELEDELKNLESARNQVEKTVHSYDELNSTTADFVKGIGTLTDRVKDLIYNIGEDYKNKTVVFESDRKTIVDSTNNASKALLKATDDFKSTINRAENKLKYCLVLNFVTVLGLIAMIIIAITK